MTNSIPLINQSNLESICLPLRFRIAKLDKEKSSLPHPEISDHPRTLACAHLIDRGLENLPFHGFDTLESILKVFGEHGIDRHNPSYQAVFERIQALNQNSPQLYRGLGKPGIILDEHRLGGGMLIRAACLARAGLDDETQIKDEIDESLDVFSGLIGITHQDELIMPYRDKFIIRKGCILPGYYHLLILAHTHGWRTVENIERIKMALTTLCHLSLPHTLLKFGSQLIAPASMNEYHWLTPWKIHYDSEKAMWIERMILVLQAGIADEELKSVIKDFTPKFIEQWSKSIRNTQPFLKWGAYTGIGLESDWKSKERKQIDLWFRQRQIECLLSRLH